MKIFVVKTTGSEFEGYVYVSDLPKSVLAELGISDSLNEDPELEVLGSFDTFVTRDEGYIEDVGGVTVYHNDKKYTLVPDKHYDENKLIQDIEKEINWDELYWDSAAQMADDMYDSFKDGLYDN